MKAYWLDFIDEMRGIHEDYFIHKTIEAILKEYTVFLIDYYMSIEDKIKLP